jgi:hypothetical protein
VQHAGILDGIIQSIRFLTDGRYPLPCRFFGWTKANEITNGRWVMFGFAVGLLTEYATGVDFPHQFGLMASYLGLLDFD